ncbi:MAG TPA: helix-turn-helix domain-containing protein [Thermomicrobiaceae bacterium]|nr:helix-turn-helix domain-containing protein [Thermomicrobiaceae bacterium]
MTDGRQPGQTTGRDTPEAMTIHQLAERSGVPERRIRHFVAQRILPAPSGRGRAAHYGPEHLTALARVQALRAMNLSLEEIRDRVGGGSDASGVVTGAGAAWRRWEIIPGIELQVRDDLDPEDARLARVLIGVARQLLADERGRGQG